MSFRTTLQLPFLVAVLGISFLSAASGAVARAEDRFSTAQRVPNPTNEKITELKWEGDEAKVRIEAHGEEQRFYVTLAGHYEREEWTLLGNNQRIKQGNFTLETPISKKALAVEFVAIGPMGEIEKEMVPLLFSDWEEKKVEAQKAPPKRLFFSPGLGVTSLKHKETGTSDYKTIALTAKASVNYLLFPPRWDFGGVIFMTVFQINRSEPVDVRYLGINARLGYLLPNVKEPWRAGIYGGMYYTTMFVSPSLFGFKNMAGPQRFPAVRRALKDGSALSGYLKISPVTNNFSLLTLSNREMAAGAAYTYPMPKGHTLSGSFDIAQISMVLKGITVSTTSITLGAGYGF